MPRCISKNAPASHHFQSLVRPSQDHGDSRELPALRVMVDSNAVDSVDSRSITEWWPS